MEESQLLALVEWTLYVRVQDATSGVRGFDPTIVGPAKRPRRASYPETQKPAIRPSLRAMMGLVFINRISLTYSHFALIGQDGTSVAQRAPAWTESVFPI